MLKLKKVDDLDILSHLAENIWKEYFPSVISEAQIEYMISKFQSKNAIKNQIDNENYEYFFIVFDDQIVGYSGIKKENNSLFLSKLYIKKEFRGKGIGSLVLSKLIDCARHSNLLKIKLTVNKNNSQAIKAYLKNDFTIVDEVCADIGNGFFMDDYIMEREV